MTREVISVMIEVTGKMYASSQNTGVPKSETLKMASNGEAETSVRPRPNRPRQRESNMIRQQNHIVRLV